MMYFVADYINNSKCRAMLMQLIAMEIIEGSKIVLHRVLQTDYQHWMSCCMHAV